MIQPNLIFLHHVNILLIFNKIQRVIVGLHHGDGAKTTCS
jgi:hypothetical protein